MSGKWDWVIVASVRVRCYNFGYVTPKASGFSGIVELLLKGEKPFEEFEPRCSERTYGSKVLVRVSAGEFSRISMCLVQYSIIL